MVISNNESTEIKKNESVNKNRDSDVAPLNEVTLFGSALLPSSL